MIEITTDEAQQDGYAAFHNGEQCNYLDAFLREAWYTGWGEAEQHIANDTPLLTERDEGSLGEQL